MAATQNLASDRLFDITEAIAAGWAELWYQPKIDAHNVSLCGAEALLRVRHPALGIVPPACLIPEDGDPRGDILAEFVIDRALADQRAFAARHPALEVAVNLPIGFLHDAKRLRALCERMPSHDACGGLIVEVGATALAHHLDSMSEIARQARLHRIAIAIDDVGAELPFLAAHGDFPFAEIKVDRQFVAGCARDPLKAAICRRVVALADSVGARSVAEGVETTSDFHAARDIGFDRVQGFLFAKPMEAHAFARTFLAAAG